MAYKLWQKKCIPCEGGVKPFDKEETQKYLKVLITQWEVVHEKKITKKFIFKNFDEAMNFVNKVADIARQEDHHPDIYIFYNKVFIKLWTHAIGGLSINDFIVASKIERLTF